MSLLKGQTSSGNDNDVNTEGDATPKKRGKQSKNTASLSRLSEVAATAFDSSKKRGRPLKTPNSESMEKDESPCRVEEAEGLLVLHPESMGRRGPGRPRKYPMTDNGTSAERSGKKSRALPATSLEKWKKGLTSWRASITKMTQNLEAAEAAYELAAAACEADAE
jgi:hypothetical protein